MIEELKEREVIKNSLDTRVPLYSIALLDESIGFPLSIDNTLIKIINKEFIPIFDERERAKSIFDWVEQKIKYGDSKRKTVGYRNVRETIKGNEGVCGEMAYVYTILARASGLRSNYISVRKDNQGDNVMHACAGIFIPHLILADPAYHKFDIKHQKYKILNDKEMLKNYLNWR